MSGCIRDDDCFSEEILPEAKGEIPTVCNEDDDEGAGAEAAKVEKALILLLTFMLVPLIEPSVAAFGAGGLSISVIPSSI